MSLSVSFVLPCYNEAENLAAVLTKLKNDHPQAEIILVDDASTDNSADIARSMGVRVVRHLHNMGNGATIKTGARHATGDILFFMDADGQHNPEDINRILEKFNEGYDMVVGARTYESQASTARGIANFLYNKLASAMTGFHIEDLTSGFRAVRAKKFKAFLYLLPNGFSYPTTITMAFFRSGFSVAYVPIVAAKRKGKSKIRIIRDGIRFLVIILKVGSLFSPMRFFLPISFLFFGVGVCYYLYTYFSWGRFTNMSALLFMTSVLTFLMGIVSEQISSLHYKSSSALLDEESGVEDDNDKSGN